MKELGLKERACKNMLANALDMEDQHRFVFSILLNSIFFYLYSTSLITSFFIFLYGWSTHVCLSDFFLIFHFLTLSHVRSVHKLDRFHFYLFGHGWSTHSWYNDSKFGSYQFRKWILGWKRVKMIGVMMKRRTMKEMNWVIKVGKAMFTVHNQSDWALWESLQNIKWDLFNLPRNWIYASNFRTNI